MKRKVVLHGPSTLTISLPYSWIRKFNIKKGQELNVEECGKELVIKIEEEPNLEKREINKNKFKKKRKKKKQNTPKTKKHCRLYI